ncbi:MAG TPA: hypothetical protein VER08_08330, partial [Pyrinomonadaceae bacterium]|nr:hypothetical protein [Pyrinomonadaceae bacterium]
TDDFWSGANDGAARAAARHAGDTLRPAAGECLSVIRRPYAGGITGAAFSEGTSLGHPGARDYRNQL